jgi:GNAT superfamily N-acetyltransferase
LYDGDANWVPPLKRDVHELIDPARHPFHEHAKVQLFVVRRGSEVVGRIAAVHNFLHVERHDELVGFFGFFECERDPDIARALFDAAGSWLAARGLMTMRGPASFSLNEECGLLVSGFDGPPVVMMPYNPPWYPDLVEDYGFTKAKDLVSYYLANAVPTERMIRTTEKLKERYNITVRPLDKKRFSDEVELVRTVYNSAWYENWGHVPMTDAEITHMAKQLKPVIEPSLVVFAYSGDDLAGFGLALPDLNVALKKMNGRLFPFGWLKALYYSRKIDTARVMILGVLDKYRRQGVAELMELEMMEAAPKRGIVNADFSWILEDNLVMRTPLEKLGAQVYRVHRMYDVQLPSRSLG